MITVECEHGVVYSSGRQSGIFTKDHFTEEHEEEVLDVVMEFQPNSGQTIGAVG